MIRYLDKNDVYYSLNDVTNWLVEEQLLTLQQAHVYSLTCKAYVTTRLASAYQQQCVYQHLEPIILPINDYFLHWIVWAKLLVLLPEQPRRHRKVDTLSLLLDNPETVYFDSHVKYGLKLVHLKDWLMV